MKTYNNNITFHVGLWKTGSTYLQKQVFPFIKNTRFMWEPSFVNFIRTISATDEEVIVSSENLSNVPYGKDYSRRRLAGLSELASVFPNSSILIVLRDPSTMLPSLYFQYIKMGGSRSFDDFIEHRIDLPAFKFSNFINDLSALNFQNVYIIFFEDLFDKAAQLENILGWQFEPLALKKKSSRDKNISLKRNGARILRFCNVQAHRLGLGSVDRIPAWNRYWLKKLRLTPHSLLRSKILRWLDNFGPSAISDAPVHKAINELSEDYNMLRITIEANR